MILQGERVVLRTGGPQDAEAIASILREPEIERRWGRFDAEAVRAAFIHDASVFVIELNGQVVGAIQYGEEENPMYRNASIDLFVTTERWGEGIGSDAIVTLGTYLFDDRGHHRLTIDPAFDNERAIGVYERGPDGTFHDGLLMELLQGELRGR